MAGLINLEMTKRIVMDSFYSEIAAAQNERLYPLLSDNIPQEVTSVTRPGFGAVPEPTQISGIPGGTNSAQSRSIKDYQFTTTVQEWDLTIDFPRSTVEDLPDEAAAKARDLASSGNVFFDKRAIAQLDGATVGYDGKALYVTDHNESGSNQDNTATGTVATPAATDIEARIGAALAKLRNFRDDQGRPVNEGVTRYMILCGPDLERVVNIALNPTMSAQAVDSSTVTGVYRGQFDIRVSAYVPTKKFYIFATNRLRKALGLYMKTPWQFTNNIGTSSDAWNYGRTALFSGYARFELLPRDWKVTVRCDFN